MASNFEFSRSPPPCRFLASRDWSHSLNGLSCGLIVLLLAVLNLCLFFGLDGSENNEVSGVKDSKLPNIIYDILPRFIAFYLQETIDVSLKLFA